MKKQITLSLLIITTTFAHTMEKESLSPCNQNSHESEMIQYLRKEKHNFEEQLMDGSWDQNKINYDATLILSKFWRDDFNYIDFFRTCYYKSYHETSIFNLPFSSDLLDTYKNTQIDGYSALSAAILTQNISHDEKLNFIQNLINLDFKFTTKDMALAELYVYDSDQIQTYKNICIHILQNNPNSHWFTLPYDVRKEIVRLLIGFFKKDIWPLPEKSEQQEDDVVYCISAGIIQTI